MEEYVSYIYDVAPLVEEVKNDPVRSLHVINDCYYDNDSMWKLLGVSNLMHDNTFEKLTSMPLSFIRSAVSDSQALSKDELFEKKYNALSYKFRLMVDVKNKCGFGNSLTEKHNALEMFGNTILTSKFDSYSNFNKYGIALAFYDCLLETLKAEGKPPYKNDYYLYEQENLAKEFTMFSQSVKTLIEKDARYKNIFIKQAKIRIMCVAKLYAMLTGNTEVKICDWEELREFFCIMETIKGLISRLYTKGLVGIANEVHSGENFAFLLVARMAEEAKEFAIPQVISSCDELSTLYRSENIPALFISKIKTVRDAEAGIEYNTLPVGVILNKVIAPSEDSGADERIDVMEYYNFIDLIPEIKSGDLKVDGINYVDGNWDVDDSAKDFSQATVTELVNIYNQTKNSVLKFPFHRSKELMDLLTSTRRDVAGVQQSLFTIFNMRISDSQLVKHAGQAIFGSYMDILNIVADQSNVLNSTIAVVEYGIMNSLLPVVYGVAKAGTPKDIEDVFSIWDRAMINYQGLPDLKSENATATAIKTKPVTAFGDVKSKLDAKEGNTEFTNKSEEKVNSKAIPEKTSGAVDNQIPKVEVVKSTSEDLDDWFKIVPDDAPLTKILVGDSVVGYAFVERVQPDGATKPFNSYTIMSDPGDHKVLDDTGVNFYKVIAFVLHTISLRKSGSVTRQVYFSDAQQLNLFKRRVIDLSKI